MSKVNIYVVLINCGCGRHHDGFLHCFPKQMSAGMEAATTAAFLGCSTSYSDVGGKGELPLPTFSEQEEDQRCV